MTTEAILMKRITNLANQCKVPARYHTLVSSKIVSNKNLPELKQVLSGKSITEVSDTLGDILRNKEELYTWIRNYTGEPLSSYSIDLAISNIETCKIDAETAILRLVNHTTHTAMPLVIESLTTMARESSESKKQVLSSWVY